MGVEIKWGGRIFWKIRSGGGHNKMKWGSKFSKNCKVTPPPPPTIKHNRVSAKKTKVKIQTDRQLLILCCIIIYYFEASGFL